MRLTLESGLDDDAWEALTRHDPAATFFHRPGWIRSLLAAYPYYRQTWIVAAGADGRVAGALPVIESRRAGLAQWLSLPYGTYGGPLAREASPEGRREIRRRLLDRWWLETGRARVVRAQLALFVPPGGDAPPEWSGFAAAGVETTHLADLGVGFERLWSEVYDGDVRTSCRKAEKLGVDVVAGSGEDAVAELAGLYAGQAAAWSDHTTFPRALFDSLERFAAAGVRTWLARQAGVTLAGLLVLEFGGMSLVWLAPALPQARPANATTLLYRRAMEDAAGRGLRWFNFGGSNRNPGIARFKEGLGGRPFNYPLVLREAAWFRPLHRLQYRLRGIEEPST